MSEHQHRHLFWPFMLIVIGVILLLEQLGIWAFSWSQLWRLWPVVLVLIGLDILLSRTRLGSLLFIIIAMGIVIMLILFVPASPRGGQGTDHKILSHPAKGIESATIYMEIGVGRLEVSPLRDSGQLFEAEVLYNKGRTRVMSDVDTDDDKAEVHLKAKPVGNSWAPFGDDNVNTWQVGLNADVPMDLEVEGGVNKIALDLRGMSLIKVDLEIGVGQAELVLSARTPYEVDIEGGVGELRLEIPTEAEARIRVDGGLGSVNVDERYRHDGRYYVTDGYEEGEGIDIDIDGGVGSIDIL